MRIVYMIILILIGIIVGIVAYALGYADGFSDNGGMSKDDLIFFVDLIKAERLEQERWQQEKKHNIVKCKDCKHRYDEISCPMHYSDSQWDEEFDGFREYDNTSDDGFCDRGERDDTE